VCFCDSDFKQLSPWYLHEVSASDYAECIKPDGAHLECGCSRLEGLSGREGAVTRRLEGRIPLFSLTSDIVQPSSCYRHVALVLYTCEDD
jgi:hypothetical protein